MMIRVVRLAGESYDLETGAQLPKAIILSNGVREFALHVDDDTALAIVEMMAEGQGARNQSVVSKASEVRVPGNGTGPRIVPQPEPEPELEVHHQTFAPESTPQPQMASVVDTPEDEDFDEEGYEPGEEYNDPATGVGSL